MIDRTFFTPRMNEWVEVAGLSAHAVLILTIERGGTRVTVPVKVSDDHWLSKLIGLSNAAALSRYHAGEEIEIPLGPSSTLAQRHKLIRLLDRESRSYDEIARLVGCDRRTVIRHVKGTSNRPKNAEQLELFSDHHPRPRHPRPQQMKSQS